MGVPLAGVTRVIETGGYEGVEICEANGVGGGLLLVVVVVRGYERGCPSIGRLKGYDADVG